MKLWLLIRGYRDEPHQACDVYLFHRSAVKAAQRIIAEGGKWAERDKSETTMTEAWECASRWMAITPLDLRWTSFSLRRWFRDRGHYQNLNENRLGEVKGSAWRHGRAWFHPRGYDHRLEFRCEWSFWTHFCALQFDVGTGDADDGLSLWVACYLFSIHLSVEGVLSRKFLERGRKKALARKWMGYEYMAWPRSTGVRIFDKAIWFEIWNWDAGWSSKQPKWMSFSFNPIDFFLGRQKYERRIISTHDALVPMPEARYQATVTIEECTWKRPRWPFKLRRLSSTIEVEKGVPVPGKGENSWDCDEDAIFSTGSSEPTVAGAVSAMVKAALSTRERHGGKNWMPERVR